LVSDICVGILYMCPRNGAQRMDWGQYNVTSLGNRCLLDVV
jgi:hypothetical protein